MEMPLDRVCGISLRGRDRNVPERGMGTSYSIDDGGWVGMSLSGPKICFLNVKTKKKKQTFSPSIGSIPREYYNIVLYDSQGNFNI